MWFSRLFNWRKWPTPAEIGALAVGGKAVDSDHADSATKLDVARTITLGGDLSGAANFDGSGNITIETAVLDDSHGHTPATVGLGKLSDSASYLRVTTPSGTMDIGPQNGTYCHIYTDRPYFYFNVGGYIAGKAIATVTAFKSRNGYKRCDTSGVIEQWGEYLIASGTAGIDVTLPIAFTTEAFSVMVSGPGNPTAFFGGNNSDGTVADARTKIRLNHDTGAAHKLYWRAVGY